MKRNYNRFKTIGPLLYENSLYVDTFSDDSNVESMTSDYHIEKINFSYWLCAFPFTKTLTIAKLTELGFNSPSNCRVVWDNNIKDIYKNNSAVFVDFFNDIFSKNCVSVISINVPVSPMYGYFQELLVKKESIGSNDIISFLFETDMSSFLIFSCRIDDFNMKELATELVSFLKGYLENEDFVAGYYYNFHKISKMEAISNYPSIAKISPLD